MAYRGHPHGLGVIPMIEKIISVIIGIAFVGLWFAAMMFVAWIQSEISEYFRYKQYKKNLNESNTIKKDSALNYIKTILDRRKSR